MNVQIKRLTKTAIIPKYQSTGAAAFDLHADIPDGDGYSLWSNSSSVLIPTGLSIAIPIGFVGIIVPRSGLGHQGLILGNGTGVIDSDYRGEIKVSLLNRDDCFKRIYHSDRVAQMLIMPVVQCQFVEVDELDETERGSGGYGSTGNG